MMTLIFLGNLESSWKQGCFVGSMKDIWIVQLPEAMSFFSWPHCVFTLHRATKKNLTLWNSQLDPTGIQVTFKYEDYKISRIKYKENYENNWVS